MCIHFEGAIHNCNNSHSSLVKNCTYIGVTCMLPAGGFCVTQNHIIHIADSPIVVIVTRTLCGFWGIVSNTPKACDARARMMSEQRHATRAQSKHHHKTRRRAFLLHIVSTTVVNVKHYLWYIEK